MYKYIFSVLVAFLLSVSPVLAAEVASGDPITASSQAGSGFSAIKANDANQGSYWEGSAHAFPYTLTVDLGSLHDLTSIVLKMPSAWGSRIENIEVLGSSDNTTFNTLVPAANYSLGTQTITFTGQSRYVRLKVNSNNSATAGQISEFEVYGEIYNPPTPTWTVQSVDVMKFSKDVVCNQPTDTIINQQLDKIVELGANYVAISTPYDNPDCGSSDALSTKWVTLARAKGLHIWHRHQDNAFEGNYSVSKNRSPDGARHLKTMTDWITSNPTLVQNGDIFTPMPEPQNGGISGITYCSGICQFANASDFNEWLRLSQMSTKLAVESIGRNISTTFGDTSGVFVGAYGFDGFVTWCDNNPDCVGRSKLEPATVTAMDNMIVIDHYPASGATMDGDLNEARVVFPNANFAIGEFGTIGATTDALRESQATDAFIAFASKTWIKGVNYWHLGPGTNEGLINTDFSNRPSFDVVKTFFK